MAATVADWRLVSRSSALRASSSTRPCSRGARTWRYETVDGRTNAPEAIRRGVKVRDPFQLRVNAYRVLLTRGRDVCVVFIPPIPTMDETFAYFSAAGFKLL